MQSNIRPLLEGTELLHYQDACETGLGHFCSLLQDILKVHVTERGFVCLFVFSFLFLNSLMLNKDLNQVLHSLMQIRMLPVTVGKFLLSQRCTALNVVWLHSLLIN